MSVRIWTVRQDHAIHRAGIAAGKSAAIVFHRIDALLKREQLPFKIVGTLLCAFEQIGLNVELLARDQIHPVEGLACEGFHIALNIGRRAPGNQIGDVLLKLLKPSVTAQFVLQRVDWT